MLHSVVVGIDEYLDPGINDLSYARADAEAVARAIETGLHPADREVHLLVDSDATYTGIRTAIGETLPRLACSEDDIVLLYFAGHGSPETAGGIDEVSRYLIAHDTQKDRIYSTAIDMEREVQRWFERLANPKLVVFFVDACFSGRAGGRTFEGPSLRKVRSEYRSGAIRLGDLDFGEGRAMISACDDDELAQERGDVGHGLFTHALLQVSGDPNEGDETLGLGELYERVRRLVLKSSGGRQQPVLNGRIVGARLPRLRHQP